MIQQNKSLGTRLVSYWAPEVITTGIFHRQRSSVLCLNVCEVLFYISQPPPFLLLQFNAHPWL